MADQTQVSQHNRGRTSPPRAAASSVSGVAHDVAALAALQFELVKAEASCGARRAVACGILLAAAILLAGGTVPVALTSAAFWLMQATQLSPAACYAWAALAGATAAATSVGVAWLLWRTSPLTFRRSRDEWARNIRWIRRVLDDQRDSDSNEDKGGTDNV